MWACHILSIKGQVRSSSQPLSSAEGSWSHRGWGVNGHRSALRLSWCSEGVLREMLASLVTSSSPAYRASTRCRQLSMPPVLREESDPGPAFGGLPLTEREPQRAREALCHQCVDLGLRDKPVLTQLSWDPKHGPALISRWGVRLLGPLQSCGQPLPAGAGGELELVWSRSGRQPGPQGGDFADTVT